MKCGVCKFPSDGQHFGRAVCRPCAGFYRRTVVYQLQYKCKADGKCPISKELRKTCSFCRFEQCKAIGMSSESIQWHRDSNGPLTKSNRLDVVSGEKLKDSSTVSSPENKQQSPSVDTSNLQLSNFNFLPSKTTSLLDQLQEGISNYMRSEKFLHYMLYPESASKATSAVNIKHDDLINMERGCLPLLQALIAQWCPIYQQLSVDVKTTILRTFFNTFSPLHKCYLNALYGDCEVNFFLHYGQYVSMNDAFFDKDKSPEFSWRMSDQCCRHSFKTCRDMKHMGIREREFAAICAIGLANDIGIIFKNDVLSVFRSQVFDELHTDIAKNYKLEEIGSRIGSLICLLLEAEFISNQVNESITMRKLLNNKVMEIFEE